MLQKDPHITITEIDTTASTTHHLGDLTPDQREAFHVFKANLTNAGLYTSGRTIHGKDERSEASHDDFTLLRFLRARRFDPVQAQKQFFNAEDWRSKHQVDDLFTSFPPDELESAKRFYPRWTGRRDKDGLPLYVYRLASLRGALETELNETPRDRRYQRIIALYEVMIRFVLPLCSSLPSRAEVSSPVTSVTTIIDLEHMSLASMWSLRHHLQQASTLATANYPETLNTIAVVNSPSFFPTVWGWIKSWFDEGTRKKIHVLGRDMNQLSELIDTSDLPAPYGGELPWKYEDEPLLDDEIKAAIGQMPRGPVVFRGQVSSPLNGSKVQSGEEGI